MPGTCTNYVYTRCVYFVFNPTRESNQRVEVFHQFFRPHVAGDDNDGPAATTVTTTATATATATVAPAAAAAAAAAVHTRTGRGGFEKLGDFVDPHAEPSPDTVSLAASCVRARVSDKKRSKP